MKILSKHVFVILIIFCCRALCYPFSVVVLPEQPQGGEGLLLRITDKSIWNYEILFKNKTYTPYPNDKGTNEIFLPLAITEKGTQKIIIKKTLGFVLEKKEVNIEVKARTIKTVYLKHAGEKMRSQQPTIGEQQKTILKGLNHKSKKKLWTEAFIIPLTVPFITNFATYRKGKIFRYFHKGIDISAKEGTKVKAANDGMIILSENNLNVYGNTFIIDHGQGVITCYFHLKKFFKKSGEVVKRGEIIAEVGSSGWSTGPHLHFGVYLQGEAVDPLWWIGFEGTNKKILN